MSDTASSYRDREISWLDFNARVLELGEDESIPLLERLRFLAIFSSNLDEFYMVRVASMKAKVERGITARNSAGLTPQELLNTITERTQNLVTRQVDLFHNSIIPQLKEYGIEFISMKELSKSEEEHLNDYYRKRIFPVYNSNSVHPKDHISILVS